MGIQGFRRTPFTIGNVDFLAKNCHSSLVLLQIHEEELNVLIPIHLLTYRRALCTSELIRSLNVIFEKKVEEQLSKNIVSICISIDYSFDFRYVCSSNSSGICSSGEEEGEEEEEVEEENKTE